MDDAPRSHILNKNPSAKCRISPHEWLAKDPETPKTMQVIVLYDTVPDCQLELSGMTLLLKMPYP